MGARQVDSKGESPVPRQIQGVFKTTNLGLLHIYLLITPLITPLAHFFCDYTAPITPPLGGSLGGKTWRQRATPHGWAVVAHLFIDYTLDYTPCCEFLV